MCRDEMISIIQDALNNADDSTLEQFYWFLVMEMGN